MNLTDQFARFALGANIIPSEPNVSGSFHIGAERLILMPESNVVAAARITFHGTNAACGFNDATGGFTDSNGVLQVETATVTAGSGCTSNGNLALTLTGAGITGSPLAVTVPLTTAAHTTATLIATAIKNALNALVAVTDLYTVTSSAATVILTSILPRPNDATLNLAIAAGLGVSAAASSANTTAGVAGCTFEIQAPVGNFDVITGVFAANAATSTGYVQLEAGIMTLSPGAAMCVASSDGNETPFIPADPVATGPAVLDIVFLGTLA